MPIVEAQVARVMGITLVRRSTPVVTVSPLVVERCAVTPPGGRQEDAVAVLFAGYLVAVMTVLGGPSPGAVIYEFLEFFFGWKAPCAAPLSAGYIVGGVAGNAVHLLGEGGAGAGAVIALCGGLAPGVVAAIVTGR